MRCPDCENEVDIPHGDRRTWDIEDMERQVRNEKWGGITCENCPAIMKISYEDSKPYIELFVLFIVLVPIISIALYYVAHVNFLFFIPVLAASMILFPALGGLAYDRRKLEKIGMRPTCEYCGAMMETENASFCPKCGARIARGTQGPPQEAQQIEIPAAQRIGTCMVCNLGLKMSDLLAWCPHCGNAAHRDHLQEWVHVRSRCPSCGEHLDEREINLQTLRKPMDVEKQKRIWRTV